MPAAKSGISLITALIPLPQFTQDKITQTADKVYKGGERNCLGFKENGKHGTEYKTTDTDKIKKTSL